MTNLEYIVKHLNANDIANFIINQSFNESSFQSKCHNAFLKWVKEDTGRFHNSNCEEYNTEDRIVNYWAWEYIFPKGKNTSKSCGRPRNISIQVWLAKQYDKKYWD